MCGAEMVLGRLAVNAHAGYGGADAVWEPDEGIIRRVTAVLRPGLLAMHTRPAWLCECTTVLLPPEPERH